MEKVHLLLSALCGIFLALWWNLRSMPLKLRLEQKVKDDDYQRQKCMEKDDLVCVNLYDGKLHHLGDAMLKNQAHFDVEDPASLTALLLGVGSGVAVSFASLPVTIGILLFSMVLYWHESHYMSLSAIVARTNSEFARRLSQDATIHAYDCHTIATAPHPSKHGHTQRFVKPLEECLAKKTKDMHRLQQGIVPAIPVMPPKK